MKTKMLTAMPMATMTMTIAMTIMVMTMVMVVRIRMMMMMTTTMMMMVVVVVVVVVVMVMMVVMMVMMMMMMMMMVVVVVVVVVHGDDGDDDKGLSTPLIGASPFPRIPPRPERRRLLSCLLYISTLFSHRRVTSLRRTLMCRWLLLQLSKSLRASRYPYVALLIGNRNRLRLACAVDGNSFGPVALKERLLAAVDSHGAELVVQRGEAQEREMSRMLREQQDREYQASTLRCRRSLH